MNYKLIMQKERYDALKERVSDKVFFIKEEIEGNSHWIYFEVEINDRIDLLDFFHAGYHAGYNHGMNVFSPKHR